METGFTRREFGTLVGEALGTLGTLEMAVSPASAAAAGQKVAPRA